MTDPDRRPTPMRLLVNTEQVISLLARDGAATPAEMAERLGIPRSSVYRLVDGLAAIDLVRIEADGRVRLHLKWLHLADAARAAMSEWSSARQTLDELSERTGQTAFLSLPRGEETVCVDWSPGRGIDVLILRPGRVLPFHAGGAGRVLMAFGLDDVRGAVERTRPAQLTAWTLTTSTELLDDVDRSQRQGFVHSHQDVTIGIGAVAVPVHDRDGALVGCLSLAGLSTEVSTRLPELLQAMHEALPRIHHVPVPR